MIKKAEEVFKEHVFHYLGSVDEHNSTVPAVYDAMRAYAEQFIDAAAEEFKNDIEELRRFRTHPERLTIRYDELLSRLHKLKEHLK